MRQLLQGLQVGQQLCHITKGYPAAGKLQVLQTGFATQGTWLKPRS
jgi:hypothetical protein